MVCLFLTFTQRNRHQHMDKQLYFRTECWLFTGKAKKFVDKIKRINLMNMSDNHESFFSFFLSTSNGAVLTYTYTYM